MKRLSIKRVNILNRPAKVSEITEQNTEEYEDRWLIEADKIKTKRLRAWRHMLAS